MIRRLVAFIIQPELIAPVAIVWRFPQDHLVIGHLYLYTYIPPVCHWEVYLIKGDKLVHSSNRSLFNGVVYYLYM